MNSPINSETVTTFLDKVQWFPSPQKKKGGKENKERNWVAQDWRHKWLRNLPFKLIE